MYHSVIGSAEHVDFFPYNTPHSGKIRGDDRIRIIFGNEQKSCYSSCCLYCLQPRLEIVSIFMPVNRRVGTTLRFSILGGRIYACVFLTCTVSPLPPDFLHWERDKLFLENHRVTGIAEAL